MRRQRSAAAGCLTSRLSGLFSLWAAPAWRPLPFCCRRTPLVSFLFLSAAGASAGSEAFVAGRSLWTFSAESYAQQVFERRSAGAVGVVVSHPLSMREGLGSACSAAAGCLTSRLSGLFSLWANERRQPGKALKHLQGTVFSAEALSRPARPAFLLPFCCRRTPLVGSRCGQRSASSLPFCCRRTPLVSFLFLSAAGASAGSEAFVAGRSLWTASALKAMRSGYLSTLGLLSSGAVGVVVSHPLSMREGLGSIPGLSMPMCACICHSLPLPGLSSLWVCCASCQDRLVRRGRVPNVTFESYIESRKPSVPRARPARTASRPARLEAALASPQRARTN